MGLKKKGIFITFEGPEGGGKSTQIRKAAAFFRRTGRKVLMLREPGGTKVSEKIRSILLDRKNTGMAATAELLLYLAARAQIVEERIRPALNKGMVVICDRFEDSTLAYQGFGRGLSRKAIQDLSRVFVRGSLKPDLTIVLDIDPVLGMARGGRLDRMEKEPLQFHRRVRRGFLTLARQGGKRYLVIDARLSIDEVAKKIRKRMEDAAR